MDRDLPRHIGESNLIDEAEAHWKRYSLVPFGLRKESHHSSKAWK